MRTSTEAPWRALGTAILLLVPMLGGCAGDLGADENGGSTSTGEGGHAALPSGFYIDPNSSVLVRDHLVLDDTSRTMDPCLSNNPNDANKVWTFGYLMSQMANTAVTGVTADAFARSWLQSWETSTQLNNGPTGGGDPLVEVRPDPSRDGYITNSKPLATLVREAWQQASGAGRPLAMNKAPFRLLAIVNRFDLRKEPRRFGEGTAGELRFVFSVLALNGPGAGNAGDACLQYSGLTNPDSGERGEQMVILEYAVNPPTDAAKRDWVMGWANLTNLERGSPEFGSALESLTQQVVVRGAGGAGRANGSALIRIRTNETANEVQWDLREFKIYPSTHRIIPDLVKQTPRGSDNGSNDLGLWMQRNSTAILNGTYVVPSQLPWYQGYSNTSFLGAHALNQFGNTVWSGSSRYPVSNDVRHEFSMNTCSGCHSRETGSLFFHIHGRQLGSDSSVSGFLGGADGYGEYDFCTTDPVSGEERCFNELSRRVTDLLSFLNTGI